MGEAKFTIIPKVELLGFDIVTVNKWIYIGLESVVGDEVVYIQEERGPSAVRC
jgi:hypothetical protein